VIFDEQGNEYLTELENISLSCLVFKIKEKRKFKPAKQVSLTIACAIPKKSKIDDIIDKLTQLGVDKIIPLETERVIVKLDKHKKITRRKRWEKIAQVAAQQSQRNTLPVIEEVKNIKQLLAESKDYDLKLIPALIGQRKTIKEAIAMHKPKNILVLIGPEGDFTAQELNLAVKAGFIPVTLGDNVLRVETAAVAVAAFVRLYENS